jgi:F-type H+-transporting ATPase subunit b
MPRRPHGSEEQAHRVLALATPAVRAGFAAAATLLLPAIAHAAEGGLQIIPDLSRLIPLLILFVVLVPILNALLFRPLLRVLDEREQRIDGARTRAAELSRQAAELVARHDEAIRQARELAHGEQVRHVEQARSQHHATVGEARRQAEQQITTARIDIARVAESARTALGAEAQQLAREIAARLLGRSAA